MDKNRIGINQLALLYLLSIAGGKFLTLPSILAKDVGHDSWLVLLFSFLWDAICLVFLLFAVRLNQEKQLDISAILDRNRNQSGQQNRYGDIFRDIYYPRKHTAFQLL